MERFVYWASKGLHLVAQLLLFFMVVLGTFDVTGRYLFNHPIKGSVDMMELAMTIVIFFSIAYTHWKREHISIDFLVERLPLRVQRIFDSAINLLITILMVLMSWSIFDNAQRLLRSNTVSPDVGLPVYVFAFLATVGTIVFALIALFYAVDFMLKAVKKS